MMFPHIPLSSPAHLRTQLLEEWVKPAVRACFERYPELRSATLLVAQYWDDEAIDAVHNFFAFSVLNTPDLQAAFWAEENEAETDPINLPGLPPPWELLEIVWQRDWQRSDQVCWEDNGIAIPAFSAFCREGAHQMMTLSDAYTPYAILRRGQDEEIEIEIVGTMQRPWLEEEMLDPDAQSEDWPEIFLRQTSLINRIPQAEVACAAR